MKLTTRFFLILMAIAVVPLLLSVFWNISQYNSTVASFYDLHKGISRLTAANVDEWVSGTNRNLAFLYEIEHPLQRKKVDEIAMIHQVTRINSEIVSLSLFSKEDKELFFLQSELVKAGKPLAAFQAALIKQVRESGTVAPGEVLCLKSHAYFPLAYPLVDGRVVVFHFSLDKLFEKLNAQKTGKTGEVFLTDTLGKPLACQKLERAGFDAEALRKLFKAGGRTGTVEGLRVDGESYAGSYSAVEKLNWVAISMQSEEELYGKQRKSIIVFSVFAVAIFAVTLVVVSLISNRIILPINNISNGVKRFLKEQRLDEVIPTQGWPEIKSLVVVLNRMMLELQAYRAFQLNQIVEEKNKAQALIDTITDGVILADDRGRLIYSNQTALNLLGIPKLSDDVVLPRSIKNEAFFKEFTTILASKEKFIKSEVEAPLPAAANAAPVVKNYRVIANQFLLATLRRPGRVVILRDITHEKALEKAKEDFFHMITHDMRAPLSTIQGYVEMLMRKVAPNPSTDRYFKSMLYSSRRLRGMIDDILNTTKLQRGTMTLVLAQLSANELITRVSDQHEPVATPKNIKLVVEPSPADLQLYGDSTLLERVITNLIGNSLKFTPSGGTITLGTSQDAENILFWVQDTGTGIPEDKREAIFEKYSQMEEHKSQGFGLGLAMCRMTVELHKGKIWVESEVGKGSRFIFTVSKKLAPEPIKPAAPQNKA